MRKESDFTWDNIVGEIRGVLESLNRDYEYSVNWVKSRDALFRYSVPVNVFQGALENIPIILCHSGPSFSGDVDIIKSSGFPVMAVDNTCLRLPRGYSIPLIVTTDMSPSCADMIENSVKSNTYTFVAPFVHPITLSRAGRGKIVLYTLDDDNPKSFISKFNTNYKFIPRFTTAGTVGCIALGIAIYLGCNPIILSGLDLSYDSIDDIPTGKEPIYFADDRATIIEFLASKMWYEQQFSRRGEGEKTTIIQTSPHLKFDNIINLPIADAIDFVIKSRHNIFHNGRIPDISWAMDKKLKKVKAR